MINFKGKEKISCLISQGNIIKLRALGYTCSVNDDTEGLDDFSVFRGSEVYDTGDVFVIYRYKSYLSWQYGTTKASLHYDVLPGSIRRK